MQTVIKKKAKDKEFYTKSGAPSSHLRHAAFPSVCYGKTIIHKPSFRQMSSLNSVLLGHPLPMSIPACQMGSLIPVFSIEFLAELHFCKSSDAFGNFFFVGRRVSKQNERVGSFMCIC